jgi:hypothetical protein
MATVVQLKSPKTVNTAPRRSTRATKAIRRQTMAAVSIGLVPAP